VLLHQEFLFLVLVLCLYRQNRLSLPCLCFYIEFYFCRTIPNSCLLIVSDHIGLILAEILAFGLSISVADTVVYIQRSTKIKIECENVA